MTSRRWDRGRRSRGGGALNIQGTLGTLLRTTLHQMGVVKDAVERQARSSLGQLDAAMLQRRHREALTRLGEVVWDLARHGELDELSQHEEIGALLDELAELEDRAHQSDEPDDGTVAAAGWSPVASRDPAASRGPTVAAGRGPAASRGPGRKSQQDMRVWRPSVADVPDAPDDPDGHDAGDEPDRDAGRAAHSGSRIVAPKRGPRAQAFAAPAVPEAAEAPAAQERGSARPDAAARGRRRSRRPDDPAAGGIAFMEDGPGGEDEDLAEYMHEDDVPRRG